MPEVLDYGFAAGDRQRVSPVFIERIARAFRLATGTFEGHGGSFWGSFDDKHAPVLEALKAGDMASLAALLADPASHDFFWGYDDLLRDFTECRLKQPEAGPPYARKLYDDLVQVAIGVGAIRCPHPADKHPRSELSVEAIVEALDDALGIRVEFPNPYRMNFDLVTSRGIASERAIQAIYQAWRVASLTRQLGSGRVVEIGAGLGRNAYYARALGVRSYTIIDIPTTLIAQAHYLGELIGEEGVSLLGETDRSALRLRPPEWLHSCGETFDLVLNVDSITEMAPPHAAGYLAFARTFSRSFLSINHEFNPFTVRELMIDAGISVTSRSPYWPRAGYVEELALIAPALPAVA